VWVCGVIEMAKPSVSHTEWISVMMHQRLNKIAAVRRLGLVVLTLIAARSWAGALDQRVERAMLTDNRMMATRHLDEK
jgi:hypothetical protein